MDENMNVQQCCGEVVLTYEPDVPKEVVLTYETPLPVGLEKRAEDADEHPACRRRRRGLVIFGIFMVILLVLTAVGLALRFAHKADERWEEEDFRWDYGNMDGTAVEKTTIPTYPVGSSFRLRPTEERMHSLTPQQIYETVNPAVVTVVAMKDVAGAGIGTGVIVSEDGFIITNFHVVEGGYDCGVLLSSGYTYEAKLVGYDK